MEKAIEPVSGATKQLTRKDKEEPREVSSKGPKQGRANVEERAIVPVSAAEKWQLK